MLKKLTRPSFSMLHVLLYSSITLCIAGYWGYQGILEARRPWAVPVVEFVELESVPTRPYQKPYSFTRDWFTQEIPKWRKALGPFIGRAGVRYLEVGVFEGRAAMWMLENVLTHPTSQLTGMDLFEGSYEEQYPDFAKRYFSNLHLADVGDRAITIKGYSQVELRKLPLNYYDIIYIDGSHENQDVLEDAVLSVRLLKQGGILIFDDYAREDLKMGAPKLGIDVFFRFFGGQFQVLHNGHQLFLKKLH